MGITEYDKRVKSPVVTTGSNSVRLDDIPNNTLKEECCQATPPEIEEKIRIHKEICDYLKNLYATKNADYGDSMHPLFEEYGLTAFLVMFEIKLNRIKSLQFKGKGHYESLEDSLLDLANYAMIAVTELRNAQNKSIDKN